MKNRRELLGMFGAAPLAAATGIATETQADEGRQRENDPFRDDRFEVRFRMGNVSRINGHERKNPTVVADFVVPGVDYSLWIAVGEWWFDEWVQIRAFDLQHCIGGIASLPPPSEILRLDCCPAIPPHWLVVNKHRVLPIFRSQLIELSSKSEPITAHHLALMARALA